MRAGRTALLCFVAILMASGCRAPAPHPTAAALIEAFNAHDPAAMATLVTDDFELYYVGDDGVATLATTGREALRQEMVEYFEVQPTVQSEIEGSVGGDRFVAFRERVVGGASSLAVYEIGGELLRRVWYFPSEP